MIARLLALTLVLAPASALSHPRRHAPTKEELAAFHDYDDWHMPSANIMKKSLDKAEDDAAHVKIPAAELAELRKAFGSMKEDSSPKDAPKAPPAIPATKGKVPATAVPAAKR